MIDFIRALHEEQMHRWANQEYSDRKFSRYDGIGSNLRNQLIDDVVVPDNRVKLRPSSSGNCLRKVVIKSILPHLMRPSPLAPALQQGTQGHLWMDQWIKATLHPLGNYVSQITPQEVTAYEFENYKVAGTPDALILVWDGPHKGKLLMPDYKFIAEYAFKKLFKEGAPEYYQMQVYCYKLGVENWLRTVGLDFDVVPYIVHYNKGKLQDMRPIIIDGGNVPQRTQNYWTSIVNACDETENTGNLPPPMPEADWECKFCDLGPNDSCAELCTIKDLENT